MRAGDVTTRGKVPCTMDMEIKKSPQADLERKRGLWLLIGYAMALSLLYIALEWSSDKPQAETGGMIAETIFEEEIELPEVPPPPPPAELPAEEPLPPEELKILDDTSDEEETGLSPDEDAASDMQNTTLPETEQPADASNDSSTFDLVEQMPEFADGGLPGLMRYLSRNIRYPAIAIAKHIQGQVTVQFIVDRDGSIADATVIQGVNAYLDREALHVIRNMPPWKPGIREGEPVRVRCTIPVIFRL